MAAKAIMIQGTMSNAGKSVLTAGLCRIFRQDGYSVAPFKSQNMALNSFVTREGLEMGRAQVMQAEAAGVEPSVRMNPILLKPSSDMGSQVIVNGEVLGDMRASDYFRHKKELVPQILTAYRSLAEEHDVIVLEGAGSPAEINLKADDIVNMGMARMARAPVLLAGDIDRGGVFASLYGTVALLEAGERAMVKGTVINKFRGDAALLRPGLTMLEELTQIPVVGVVPWLELDLDDEDSLSPRLTSGRREALLDVAVVRLPHISNFTDFNALGRHPAVGLRYTDRPEDLGRPDLVILPGTKSTLADLDWLRRGPRWRGSAAAIRCWDSGWTTRRGRREAAPGRGWACCPSPPGFPGKRPAPAAGRPSRPAPACSPRWRPAPWRAMRSTWGTADRRVCFPSGRMCWAPISTAFSTRRSSGTGSSLCCWPGGG